MSKCQADGAGRSDVTPYQGDVFFDDSAASKLLPQVQTVLLRNCGHLPMVEHQTMTAGIISAFVDGMSALQAKARRPVLSPSGKAASQLFRLMAQTLYRTEQTPAGRVQTAQDSISTKA